MSRFAVTLEEIRSVRPIPGADRIQVATLAGMDFEFVIARDQFRPGDRVLYLPVDSLLPPALVERLGLAGRLAGPQKNRIKTITLRGQISQGLVTSPSLLPEGMTDPDQITAHLGIQKYEPPEEIVSDGILTRLPEGQGKYDIESADRFVALTESLMDAPVFITEKVEGSNFWVRGEAGSVSVGQREHTILPKEGTEHTFHLLARRLGLDAFAMSLSGAHGRPAVVYGEALGPKIQGNIYGLPQHTVRLFDVKVGPSFLDPAAFLAAVQGFFGDLALVVPILLAPGEGTLGAWLAGRSLKEASNGTSLLADRPREGIVVKPLQERYAPDFGRVVLKQRSPFYLSRSDL